jgi:uncharacterized membrane protein YdfJ with MMPL/SSD domain
MMSVSLAMGIDYSMFLVTRFREEVLARRGLLASAAAASAAPLSRAEVLEIVAATLASAGHTVLVSGTTLALCFFGLCAFSMNMLRSTGLACGIAVSVVVLVTLCVTPAALLTFPAFFSRPFLAGPEHRTAADRCLAAAAAWACATALPAAARRAAACPTAAPSWRGYTEALMRPRVAAAVVLVLTGCAVPLAMYATSFEYQVGFQ